jgi:hypothetical protein
MSEATSGTNPARTPDFASLHPGYASQFTGTAAAAPPPPTPPHKGEGRRKPRSTGVAPGDNLAIDSGLTTDEIEG